VIEATWTGPLMVQALLVPPRLLTSKKTASAGWGATPPQPDQFPGVLKLAPEAPIQTHELAARAAPGQARTPAAAATQVSRCGALLRAQSCGLGRRPKGSIAMNVASRDAPRALPKFLDRRKGRAA